MELNLLKNSHWVIPPLLANLGAVKSRRRMRGSGIGFHS